MDAITPHVKERPIIFSAPMVHAILEGRKTQTRRIIKHRGESVPSDLEIYVGRYPSGAAGWFVNWRHDFGPSRALDCPYGKAGDRLWVRETTWVEKDTGAFAWYVHQDVFAVDPGKDEVRKKPAIHMRRNEARILLEVVSVRVERLQQINEEDAKAEGVTPREYRDDDEGAEWKGSCWAAFIKLWVSIHGQGSYNVNPWVWVVEFKRVDAA